MPLLNDLRTRLCADALGARDSAVVMVKIWLTENDLLSSRTAASSLCSLFVPYRAQEISRLRAGCLSSLPLAWRAIGIGPSA